MPETSESKEFVPIYTAFGHLAAEMIRLMLVSMNIPAILSQESAGAAMGLTVGRLGEVKILVPANRVEEASDILQAMDQGKLDSEIYPEKYPPQREYKSNKASRKEIYKEND
jgi:Putative prokaryotic signal transducing protein